MLQGVHSLTLNETMEEKMKNVLIVSFFSLGPIFALAGGAFEVMPLVIIGIVILALLLITMVIDQATGKKLLPRF